MALFQHATLTTRRTVSTIPAHLADQEEAVGDAIKEILWETLCLLDLVDVMNIGV